MIRKIIAFILAAVGILVMMLSDQLLLAWSLILLSLSFYTLVLFAQDYRKKTEIDNICKGV